MLYGWHHRQRRRPSRAGGMVNLEGIDRRIVRPEDSPQAQRESIRGHNQTGSDVWKRMLGVEGEQEEEDCHHGDDDATRNHRSVETGSHAKRRNSTNITPFTDRRGYAQWPSSVVWTCAKNRCEQHHPRPQSDGPDITEQSRVYRKSQYVTAARCIPAAECTVQ